MQKIYGYMKTFVLSSSDIDHATDFNFCLFSLFTSF